MGKPGVGKTRIIREGKHYIEKLADPFLAPISVTFASLVDCLVKCKRNMIVGPDPVEYNSIYICADELGAFIHKYDNEMIDGLSAFYDPTPYSQNRRTSDIKVKIKSPQANILCGSTPANLTEFMPEKAWGQGFTSRLIMVYSDEVLMGDDFIETEPTFQENLAHDLNMINTLYGKFTVTKEYQEAVQNWRQLKEGPVPTHPKLTNYISRRRVHLYKLSMVSSIDRSGALILTRDDFNRAMGWLLEAEQAMPDIFEAGATNLDGQAIEEIAHYILYQFEKTKKPISETTITRLASQRIPIHSVDRVIGIMERTGQIKMASQDKITRLRFFVPGGII